MAERIKVKLAVFNLLLKRGNLLMMRRFNTGHEDGNYGVPSGHVEPGETPDEAVIRETEEETGIIFQPGDLHLVHTQFNASSGWGMPYVNLYYSPRNLLWSGEPRICEPDQCDDMRWFGFYQWDAPNELPKNTISYVRTALLRYDSERNECKAHGYTEVRP